MDNSARRVAVQRNLVQEFYKFRKGSKERERIWTQISENLNSVTTIKFKLNQRVVRERFDLLLGRCRQQSKEEAKASSASPEPTELDRRIVRRERETSRINERIL